MNPNAIVLTPEVYEQLKADLKRELMCERRTPVYSSSWEEIKLNIEKKYSSPSAYQITNGISAILRNVLDLPNIKYLKGETGENAVQIFTELIRSLEELKGE